MKKLGACVQVMYGTGEKKEIACVEGQTTEPVYFLVDASGNKYTWVQSLCRPCTLDEEIDYWRSRALVAESERAALVTRALDGQQEDAK